MTMSQQRARKAYSAEELLALRRSASDEPAEVIQKRAVEDAIRDHVVRGSRSSEVRAASSTLPQPRSRVSTSLEAISFTAPVLGEIDSNNQHLRMSSQLRHESPTSTLEKKAAEHILQQHGSPPHIRVTAGGRIVPSEQSPLCSPRYGYSAINKNGSLIKFAPGYPPPVKTFPNIIKALPEGFVAQDPHGRLCQAVDGQLLAIPEVDGIPQLFVTAPNVTNMAWAQHYGTVSNKPVSPALSDQARIQNNTANRPSIATQVGALEKQYQKLENERRALDKAEVLKRSELTGKAYNQLIQKRRELVNTQDELRRSIKILQEGPSPPSTRHSFRSSTSPESHVPRFEGSPPMLPSAGWFPGMPSSTPFPPYVMSTAPPDVPILYPNGLVPSVLPSWTPFPQFENRLAIPTSHNDTNVIRDVANAGTRPGPNLSNTSQHMSRTDVKSFLNPMSPSYQPAVSVSAINKDLEQKEPHSNHVPMQVGTSQSPQDCADPKTDQRESSDASFATADFFPNNPKEHSLQGHLYTASSCVASPVQTTPATIKTSVEDDSSDQPEKERHNSNWNPTIPQHAFRSVKETSSTDSSRLRHETSHTFARGFQAGLARAALGTEHDADFIEGYCKGLTESSSGQSSGPSSTHRTGGKPVVRLPSANNDRSRGQLEPLGNVAEPETSLAAKDKHGTKQVIISSHDESATVPPRPSETTSLAKNLGHPSGSTAPPTIAPSNTTDSNENVPIAVQPPLQPHDQTTQPTLSDRVFSAPALSVESQTPYLQRMYPATRVLSSGNLDYKVGTTGHMLRSMTGYFAQFDGTTSKAAVQGLSADASRTKFYEESLGEEDKLVSPSKSSTASSPRKSISPTKLKFAAIANKAGIKVRADRPAIKGSNDVEPDSPKDRRRWRDVWKNRNTTID